ncbi:RNA methyltransferase [Flavobacterium sp.]|uniref:TrmH family RNA methyltransferase n=1 Tax=Flavobacterium sp. TaxID=239 RepID=UPI00262B392F|nr:RNA methyltransferase [Flavobacterium sp.]MDD3005533.1 RNA methyltransferase [Flavobacterium sp.]
MVSKNQIKLINSLHQKKFRQINKLFIAEGIKVIQELLNAQYELDQIYSTEPLFEQVLENKKTLISDEELKKISALTVPNNCLAVFKIPAEKKFSEKGLIVALDSIRDPGNLGTIIRICDWFGIEQIICSPDTVDVYNPKVIQATMGSISRVNFVYTDLVSVLQKTKLPVFGTFMDGENIYKMEVPKEGIIVMGNEANGISEAIEKIVKNKISIPRFGTLQKTESLNVATATAIILSEFRRKF